MTLSEAAAALAAISDTPRLDAELLLAHTLGISRDDLLLNSASPSLSKGWLSSDESHDAGQGFDRLSHAARVRFDAAITRRLAHEPVAYITGTRDFWSISLNVSPAVLIPRPDSETLIEAAVAHYGTTGPRRILDLGTGSGALLLAALAEWPQASGIGIDASPDALGVAAANAARIAPGRTEMRLGNWTDGLDERFDLILCNPPYVETGAPLSPGVVDHEPHAALFAGSDGLDAYRLLIPQLPSHLAPGGIVALEIGATQGDAVAALAVAAGFAVSRRNDLSGRERCLVLSLTAAHLSLGGDGISR